MKKKRSVVISIYYIAVFVSCIIEARSIHRPADPHMPCIATKWVGARKEYKLRNDHLDPYIFFKVFDRSFFNSHLLPMGQLSFRYEPHKKVNTNLLKQQIEVLFAEIRQKKKSYTHFTILQAKDFNRRKGHGLIILKFNDYPFVVKLFIERPETFVSPYHKGIEPIFFFYLGGGVNRHLAGFTRIKTLDQIREKIAQSTEWKARVDMPRKWFYLPSEAPWIEITGTNMGAKRETKTTHIPGTYCIIADAIDAERSMNILDSAEDKKTIIELCNYLDLWIDPHLNNYMVEKRTKKIVLADTEHFATLVGFKKPIHFDSHTHWYLHLAGKFLHDTWGKSKKERRFHTLADDIMRLA